MKRIIFIFLLLSIIPAKIYTQEYIKGPGGANIEQIWLNSKTNEISYIEFHKPVSVRYKLRSEWLRNIISAPEGTGFIQIKEDIGDVGQHHYKYQQTFKGYPVEGFTYTLNDFKGRIFSINGNYLRIETINPIIISEDKAMFIVADGDDIISECDIKLIIFNKILCYKLLVYHTETMQSEEVYVNTENGKILKRTDTTINMAPYKENNNVYRSEEPDQIENIVTDEYSIYQSDDVIYIENKKPMKGIFYIHKVDGDESYSDIINNEKTITINKDLLDIPTGLHTIGYSGEGNQFVVNVYLY